MRRAPIGQVTVSVASSGSSSRDGHCSVIADVDRSLSNFLGARSAGNLGHLRDTERRVDRQRKRPAVSCFLHRVVEDIDRRDAGLGGRTRRRRARRRPPATCASLPAALSSECVGQDGGGRASAARTRDGGLLVGEIVAGRAPRRGVRGRDSSRCSYASRLPCTDPGPQAHDVWSSLGCSLRASLELMLVAPLRPALVTDIAPPAEELSMTMESIGRGSGVTDADRSVSPRSAGRRSASGRSRRQTIPALTA